MGAAMTWLFLRYWYGHHRHLFNKWEERKYRWNENRWKPRINSAMREKRIYRKRDHHAFWFDHYCSLLSAYGHKIECIHFGADENTIQAGSCPHERR